ncbi:hypothetical protein QJS10_CPA01g00523 [Acorus calamus]|uniref:Remorin C-terminal domain-containing protein n=1 Tax=Acorus calamus TaxID=4465 RepID=A0AAV9FUY4_ACOCL|nr:hypothetical protein QJS10_CPA01g00523 [Acorus calamus]
MEYERIHKAQTGMISPTKLRMKLLGAHNQRRKSVNSSPRASPPKLGNSDQAKNSLLEAQNDNANESGSSKDSESVITSISESQAADRVRIHPVRSLEDDGAEYDSGHDNVSVSSFEFHRGERTAHHNSVVMGPFSRPVPSKWNDAEKWVSTRNTQSNLSKRILLQGQTNRQMTKPANMYQTMSQNSVEQFSFVPVSESQNGIQKEMDSSQSAGTGSSITCSSTTVVPTVRSVCMRDMGTEMTPVASQEPSRTGTPIDATTPTSHSPISSMPSTPGRGAPTSTPAEVDGDCKATELSERELQLKTRREIIALGVQLGKLNIAAWASKDDDEPGDCPPLETNSINKDEEVEFKMRAEAWEEVERSKHAARYKHEEMKIQAWEDHQRAKFEAKMRKIEAQAEQMRAQAGEKVTNKMSLTKRRSEEKRAAARARRDRNAARTARQVECIRRDGRVPTTSVHLCCLW